LRLGHPIQVLGTVVVIEHLSGNIELFASRRSAQDLIERGDATAGFIICEQSTP
jgi:hypothetical protein